MSSAFIDRVERPAAMAGLTRKQFLWRLGAGTAAIAGYFLLPTGPRAAPPLQPAAGPADEPWLRSEVMVAADGEGLRLSHSAGTGPVICAVNGAGAEVVRRLDGRTPVAAIAGALAASAGIDAGQGVEARVAGFVAQLGELGFLRAPFYAVIAEPVDG